jgi:hypothetical protein
MNIKQIKKLLQNEASVFQVLKTDSVYLNKSATYELIELNADLGIYKVITKLTFNQFIKFNLSLSNEIQNKNYLYTKTFYKFIKE